MKPRISVIIPVYNVEKYLSGCLDSLLAQTFTDYEAICVNDGSTDGSLVILEEYAANDARIKIISQCNKGLSGARNTGMDVAQGEYLFFLDSDDYIHPQALEFLYRCAVENDVELVCAGYQGNSNLYSPIAADIRYDNVAKSIYDNPIMAYYQEYKKDLSGMVWTKLYNRNFVADIRFIEGRLYEDEAFTALIMEKCKKIISLDFNMYNYYYGRSDAITNRADEHVLKSHLENIRFLCEHFAYDKELALVIKRNRVRGILFGSCLKSFMYLNKQQADVLKVKLVDYVRALFRDGLIHYNDFDILCKYKLYRLLNGAIPIGDLVVKNYMRNLYWIIKKQLSCIQ